MQIQEKSVSLHPLNKNNGRVAQLNRVADYGSAGYRFESCRDHRDPLQGICRGFLFFCTGTVYLRVKRRRWEDPETGQYLRLL